MVVNKKKIILCGAGIFAFLAVFSGGAIFGYWQRPEVEKVVGLINKETRKEEKIDFSSFWTAWNIVVSKYASKENIDKQKLVWGATKGMVNSLGDQYSTFFPPQESKEFQDGIRGDLRELEWK